MSTGSKVSNGISSDASSGHFLCSVSIGGSKGGDARDARPQGPNSFIFMQFSAKNLQNNPIWELAQPPRENPGSATGI